MARQKKTPKDILFKEMTDEEIDTRIKYCINSHKRNAAPWTERDELIRRRVILNLVGKGYSFRKIVEELTERWEVTRETINKYYKDAMDYISELSEENKESIREKAIERLESVMQSAAESNDMKTYLSASEQINKIQGLYSDKKEITIKDTEINFKFGE